MNKLLLKNAIYALIKLVGLEKINDTLAEIAFDKATETKDVKYDLISEAYDKLNIKIEKFNIKL